MTLLKDTWKLKAFRTFFWWRIPRCWKIFVKKKLSIDEAKNVCILCEPRIYNIYEGINYKRPAFCKKRPESQDPYICPSCLFKNGQNLKCAQFSKAFSKLATFWWNWSASSFCDILFKLQSVQRDKKLTASTFIRKWS